MLQCNYDESDDEWNEPKHKSYPLLLYVSETLRSSDLNDILTSTNKFDLLRHKEL